MGSDYPKVNNLEGLGDYATSILTFAENYTQAANQTYRTYQRHTDSQDGQAIDAFLAKLESLQSQVFDQFPAALETYGQTVATYQTTLTGYGFQDKMWSDSNGANDLSQLYKGEQTHQVEDAVSHLKQALEIAAEATGTEAPNLSSIETTATDGLQTAGSRRTTLADNINSAWTNFTDTLTDNARTILGFQGALQTARYLSSIPVREVVQAIQRGTLGADEMYYFDVIQGKTDAKVLKLLLKGSPKTIGQLTDQKTEHISQGMYNVLYAEMEEWYAAAQSAPKGKEAKRLNALVNAIGQADADWVKAFSGAMLVAGNQSALVIQAQMQEIYQKTGNLKDARLLDLQKQLTQVNNVNGLYQALYVIENKVTRSPIGRSRVTIATAGSGESGIAYNKLHLRFDGRGGFTLTNQEVIVYHGKEYPQSEATQSHYTSSLDSNSTTGNISINQERLKEIRQKREKAVADFSLNVGLALATGGVGRIVKESLPLINSFGALLKGDGIGSLAKLGSTALKEGSSLAAGLTVADQLQSQIFQLNKSLDGADRERSATYQALVQTITDKGGWKLTNNETNDIYASSDHYYDFSASLRLQELDHQGVTGFLKEKGIHLSQTDAKQIFKDQHLNISSEVRDYLLGQGHGKDKLTLATMTDEQSAEFTKGLDALLDAKLNDGQTQEGTEIFLKNLQEKYVIGETP